MESNRWITHRFMEACQKSGEKKIKIIEDGKAEENYTFSQLKNDVESVLAGLKERGVSRGDYVLLNTSGIKNFLQGFWGCCMGGIIPMPVAHFDNTMFGASPLTRIIEKTGNIWLLTDVGGPYEDNRVLELDKLAKVEEELSLPVIDGRDVAYIQFSSGSTSDPKGVVITHEAIVANMEAIHKRVEIGKETVGTSWLPLSHNLGLIPFHILPMCYGLSHVLTDTRLFIKSPIRFLKILQKEKANITAFPDFALKWMLQNVEDDDVETLDLSALEAIFNGSEPVDAGVIRIFENKMIPGRLKRGIIYPVYGMAEAVVGISIPRKNSGVRILEGKSSGVSLGEALDGIQMEIRDDEGNPVSQGEVGEIVIKGSCVAKKRIPDFEESDFTMDGFLRTGDLGFMSGDEVCITGRKKDMFILNGKNYYLNDIDKVLERNGMPGLAAAYIQMTKELIIFAEQGMIPPSDKEKALGKANVILGRDMHISASDIVIVPAIPRTVSGKIRRFMLVQACEEMIKKEMCGNDKKGDMRRA